MDVNKTQSVLIAILLSGWAYIVYFGPEFFNNSPDWAIFMDIVLAVGIVGALYILNQYGDADRETFVTLGSIGAYSVISVLFGLSIVPITRYTFYPTMALLGIGVLGASYSMAKGNEEPNELDQYMTDESE